MPSGGLESSAHIPGLDLGGVGVQRAVAHISVPATAMQNVPVSAHGGPDQRREPTEPGEHVYVHAAPRPHPSGGAPGGTVIRRPRRLSRGGLEGGCLIWVSNQAQWHLKACG
jgi:hypothetical protein